MAGSVYSENLSAIQEVQRLATASVVDHSRDGESRFAEILAILIVGSVLSTAAVILRAFTRIKMLHTFGLDDIIMVVAQILVIGTAVAIGLETLWGLGRHSWVQPPEDYSFYVSIVLYNIATTIVKLSILLQYRRIVANDLMQKLTTWGLAFMSAWTVMLCFLLPMMCVPVQAFWDTTVKGRCIDLLASWYTMAAVNIVADFVMFSLPIPVINSLQLPRRQKRMLLFVFGLGFVTCIISAFRIKTLRVAAQTEDPYWDNVDAATWSFLEVTIGILAACLPTLRPIFVTLLPRLFNGSTFQAKSKGRPSRYINPYGHASESNKVVGVRHGLGRHQPLSSTERLNNQIRDEIELSGPETETSAEYTVSVSTGASGVSEKISRMKSQRDSGDEDEIVKGHIRTTTVVTQEVTFDNAKRDQMQL
ncbi:integral membrane protein [Colletotrichum tofieldiae]|uniref:Integral membrane protein n=1 Tax=Colletotrichum tofieldiae TaxID=708197 RepID=A0A166ZDT7_9PEZI|nr:integral membrane protein [Colletotrichum tofieldiae]